VLIRQGVDLVCHRPEGKEDDEEQDDMDD
jgi:hypothetical protein